MFFCIFGSSLPYKHARYQIPFFSNQQYFDKALKRIITVTKNLVPTLFENAVLPFISDTAIKVLSDMSFTNLLACVTKRITSFYFM